MKRHRRKSSPLALALAALGVLAFATSAQAATLNLKCSGKGPQDKGGETSTAFCGVEAGKTRNVEGVLRNDKNKPVAGTLMVTFSNWIPQGGGAYSITPAKTIEVKAAANGKFTIPKVTTMTEESLFIEAVGDEATEVSTVAQEVNIQRIVTATVKKLGGGSVKVTMKGAKAPFKLGITEGEGYFASGGTAKKASKAGTAIFHLGRTSGVLNVFFEAGELTDLYYFAGKSFKP